MLTGLVHVLPPHEPCGTSVGRVVGAGLRLTCEEIREFAKCERCKPPKDAPTRGDPRCPSCHGLGALIARVRPGCGAVSTVDVHGLRAWVKAA